MYGKKIMNTSYMVRVSKLQIRKIWIIKQLRQISFKNNNLFVQYETNWAHMGEYINK